MKPEEAMKRWGKIFSSADCTGCPLDNRACWEMDAQIQLQIT